MQYRAIRKAVLLISAIALVGVCGRLQEEGGGHAAGYHAGATGGKADGDSERVSDFRDEWADGDAVMVVDKRDGSGFGAGRR